MENVISYQSYLIRRKKRKQKQTETPILFKIGLLFNNIKPRYVLSWYSFTVYVVPKNALKTFYRIVAWYIGANV